MNSQFRLCVAAASAFVFALVGVASESSAATAEILRVDSRRMEALVNSDVAALRQIFSDDLVYVHASGRVQSKAEYLALLANRDLRYLSMVYEGAPRVRLLGRDAAVVNGKVVLTSQGKTGTPNHRVLSSTGVYARETGEWKLVSFQSTILAQP